MTIQHQATSKPNPLPRNDILLGDAATVMGGLASCSIDMVFTSPPYFNLRDYQAGDAEIGRERDVNAWVERLLAVTRQAHRVLTPTGTLWLNLGDTYAASPRDGALRKSLMMGPERLALRLIAGDDGRGGDWILRNKLIWAKRNHLPCPVNDRLTNAWEYVYVFSRSPHYHFDLDAIRVPHTSRPPRLRSQPGSTSRPPGRTDTKGPSRAMLGSSGIAKMHAEGRVGHPLGKNPGDVWTVPTSQYRGDHRATMPIELARRAITAACPELRCTRCRAPWHREINQRAVRAAVRAEAIAQAVKRGLLRSTCTCEADVEPGIVLDPFLGSGTTALAARELGRDWLGIELNEEYGRQAAARIASGGT